MDPALIRSGLRLRLAARSPPGGAFGATSNKPEIMHKLTAIEESIAQSQKESAAVLIAALGNTAGARYLANLAVA